MFSLLRKNMNDAFDNDIPLLVSVFIYLLFLHTHTHSATFSLSKMAAKILHLTHLAHGAVNLTNCCYFTVHRRHYREQICWDFTHFFKHLFL